ncbi:alpha-L-fucosidase [Flexithrix dorotheae]|uniref:alpha-L-fucosidase n=1 Tax=Flexithrix dorotheae TaxID=70993 RepID=UPI000361C7C7|nr:alpha-L-fucosidase [Flexithrix dorotheae]
MNRRNFINRTSIAAFGGTGLLNGLTKEQSFFNKSKIEVQGNEILPTAAQKTWMDLHFGMFVHFGINTFYDKEWSDGSLDPSAFNPKKLDTDQWCRVAKAAGMKYIVLTTKHHDGFCLWPSKQTSYGISSSPFKKDVLAELANSAQKHGLKLGLYYSIWDAHEPKFKEDWWAFIDFMKFQLEELLTGYGEVVELWFDGFWKQQRSGWTKKNENLEGEADFEEKSLERDLAFIQAWRSEGAFKWQMDHIYQFIKSIQPNCLVMNNSTSAYPGVPLHPVDIRSGEKYTSVEADRKVWNWLGEAIYLPLQIETTMSVKGNEKFPSGNWFWHDWDHSVLSKEEIKNYLSVAKSMKANLLLNVGITNEGKLRKEDEATLLSL